MSVKKLDSLPNKSNFERRDALQNDIREIIENRIEISEIVDYGYAEKSMPVQIKDAIRRVAYKEYGVRNAYQVFKVRTHREHTKTHFYVVFDVDAWEKEVTE